MREKVKKIFKENAAIFFYFILYLAIFWKYLFSSGMPAGNDWAFPAFGYQLKNWLIGNFFMWNDSGAEIFGSKVLFSVTLPFQFIGYCLNLLFGTSGELYQKILFLISFLIGGLSTYYLFLEFKSRKIFSFLGGLLFTLNPVTFNFILMGWNLIFISIFIFPLLLLLFEKYFKTNSYSFVVIAGILFGIFGFNESQSIIHFPLILTLYFFIKRGFTVEKTKEYFKVFLTFTGIAISFHFSWIFILLVIGDSYASSPVSINDVTRFSLRFSFLNMLRGWGSVFNYQFEYIYPYYLMPLSFLVTFIYAFKIIAKKVKNRTAIFFFLLFFYPFLTYIFSNYFSSRIPFSNIVRDFGRSFPYLFLSFAFFLSTLDIKTTRHKMLFMTVFILYLFPFFSGGLFIGNVKYGTDQRLRIYNIRNDFFIIDNYLSVSKNLDRGSIFLPFGDSLLLENDARFNNGEWSSFWDYSTHFSNKAKNVMRSGSNTDNMNFFLSYYDEIFLENKCNPSEINLFIKYLNNNSIRYLLLKKEVLSSNKKTSSGKINNCLNNATNLKIIKETSGYLLYKIDIPLKTILYSSKGNIISKRGIDELPRIISDPSWQTRSTVFFEDQNVNKIDKLSSLKEWIPSPLRHSSSEASQTEDDKSALPVLEFRKINPTKYRVRVHSATKEFPLIFSESFHDGWRAYVTQVESQKSKVESNLDAYKILDGNEEDQASKEELEGFIKDGCITDLGDEKEKETKHLKWNEEKQKEELDYIEKYNIDFVSKNFQGTIQNDNLPKGHFWETWFQEPIENNENHLMANGYANSWVIDSDNICRDIEKCTKNPDGSYDFELVVEFWPQRLFYVGLGISGLTLLGCLGYLAWDWRRNRDKISSEKNES